MFFIEHLKSILFSGRAPEIGTTRTPALPSVFRIEPKAMLRFYSQFMRPGDLCFDIGANLGNRLTIFRQLGARVVALEPQDACFKELTSRFDNDPQVTLLPLAAADRELEFEMHVANVNTISSMSTEWIEKTKKSGRFSDYRWDQVQKVKSTTLDKLIATHGLPRFIKIDVEGFELPVILGLSQPVPCLSFEWTPEFSQAAWDCLDHLAGIGDIETNYSLGESMLWAAEQWMKPVQLKTALAAYENDIKHFGDIYVRFP